MTYIQQLKKILGKMSNIFLEKSSLSIKWELRQEVLVWKETNDTSSQFLIFQCKLEANLGQSKTIAHGVF